MESVADAANASAPEAAEAAAAIAAIAAHPRMPQARRKYIEDFLNLYGSAPFLARLLLEQGRFFVHFFAVVHYALHDPAKRESWCTMGALRRAVAVSGMASPRQVDHLIRRLQDAGFVAVEPAPEDGRVKLVLPTETMLEHDRRWLAVHHAHLSVLWPERDYSRALQADRRFQLAHRRATARWNATGIQVMKAVPETMLFFRHAGGHMVRSVLLMTAMEQEDAGSVQVPFAQLAEQFGVSRTQVRLILRAAEELDLVRLVDRGGHRVEVRPKLWSSFDEGVAGGMYMHDLVYQLVR